MVAFTPRLLLIDVAVPFDRFDNTIPAAHEWPPSLTGVVVTRVPGKDNHKFCDSLQICPITGFLILITKPPLTIFVQPINIKICHSYNGEYSLSSIRKI